MQPFTLDNDNNALEGMWTGIKMPTGGTSNQFNPAHFAPALAEMTDEKAPGIREQISDPGKPYLGPYRSNLFQRNDVSANNNPLLSYQAGLPSAIASPWAQRTGAAWWTVCYDTINREHWMFRDWGEWNNEPSGFTALRNLRPVSTMGSTLNYSQH